MSEEQGRSIRNGGPVAKAGDAVEKSKHPPAKAAGGAPSDTSTAKAKPREVVEDPQVDCKSPRAPFI